MISGLELFLNLESYEYSGSMTDTLGVALFISPYSPSRFLDPTTVLPVYPGMHTTIGVQRVSIIYIIYFKIPLFFFLNLLDKLMSIEFSFGI